MSAVHVADTEHCIRAWPGVLLFTQRSENPMRLERTLIEQQSA
jgi:hypothetical protein